MNQSLRVLVYGATGAQASPVVFELLRRGHRPVVVTRNAAKAAPLAAAGARVVEADLGDRERLFAVSQGMDAVALLIPFVTASADVPTLGRNAIDAARAAGVSLLVWNTSAPLPPAPTGNALMDTRLAIADHLRASGLPHITVQPMVYAENLLSPWVTRAVASNDRLAYPYRPEVRVAWTAAADVGALTVAALERPELAGQAFVVSGQESFDGYELAAAFSEVLGRSIRYHPLPPREFGSMLDAALGPGAGAGAASYYEQVWQSAERPVLQVDMAPVLARLPVRLRGLRAWIAEYAAAFTPGVSVPRR
jgi:uncharacterized protein YbjT (DUF2867 family)